MKHARSSSDRKSKPVQPDGSTVVCNGFLQAVPAQRFLGGSQGLTGNNSKLREPTAATNSCYGELFEPHCKKDTTVKTLNDAFHHTLKDIYYAEQALTKALPKVAKATNSSKLKKAVDEHLEETREQIELLKKVFSSIDKKPEGEKCDALSRKPRASLKKPVA